MILLIEYMHNKIKYDGAIFTIDTLPIVEPCIDIYNLLKLEEIINTRLNMIPSTQSNIIGCVGMYMQPEIYALSEPNLWHEPKQPQGNTP